MGKINSFQICYDNPDGIFYSGSHVEGNVTIDLSAPLKLRGIHIKFKGEATVKWGESPDHESGTSECREFKAEEKYFEHDILLYGNAPSENYCAVELDTGHHDLPFRFQLPHGIPSSFDAQKGHVSYKATAKIVRLTKDDEKTTRPFTVVGLVDLNSRPEYRSGVSGSNQKHLCCCCCKSGPISAQFYVERQGWVSGEAIRLYADIRNMSTRTIDKSYVTLTMKTQFHTPEKTAETTKEVARVTRPSIAGLAEDSWRGELLFIPSVPPSNLGGCSIINVEYTLQLNIDPSGLSLDLEIPLSIIIGTIPLSVTNQPLFVAPAGAPPPFTNNPSAPPDPINSFGFPNQPPPSYMESIITGGGTYTDGGGDAPGERTHLNASRSFTPSYTYYNNWGEPTADPTGADVKK